MVEAVRRRAKYDDLLSLPENVIGEIVDGELIASPRPATRHARAAGGIATDLTGPFDRGKGGPGGWWILPEPELHLGEDVLVPDLAGWRRERLPILPDAPYLGVTPDWVCEVVSPSTASVDRVRKLPVYARAAVGHAWLVDPLARSLEVFRQSGGQWILVAGFRDAECCRAEPFEAVEIDLAAWWMPAG